MVARKAHNLETENACVGSIPTPATNIVGQCKGNIKGS